MNPNDRIDRIPELELCSAEQFKDALGACPAAVSVITAIDRGAQVGCTATAVTSVSAEPPTKLLCLDRHTGCHAAIQRSNRFAINVLGQAHEQIAHDFGATDGRPRRFLDGNWGVSQLGLPLLLDCVAAFDCIVERHIEYSTHTITLGLVRHAYIHENDAPLIRWRRMYARTNLKGGHVDRHS
jgi:flavin reductase (DIM6/NTAB) family NADH-FMN oxidoreductase RutF